MTRFTFAKGNAKKLLSVPLYALGGMAGLVVPRRAGSWVFGCGSGLGEGALALVLYAREQSPAPSVTWLARNTAELEQANALGLPAVLRSSWRGFWRTLRAEVIVVTHGLGDANRFGVRGGSGARRGFGVRGGFVVQLWHGIPLKRIQLDSAVTFRGRFTPRFVDAMLRGLYRRNNAVIRLLPAASEYSAQRLRTAFGLDADRVVVTGDPRDDVLLRGTQQSRLDSARQLLQKSLGELDASRVLLYAPTWRDGARDPGVPSDSEWRAIAGYLEASDSLLVLRPHPHSVGDYRAGPVTSARIRMLDAASQNDITPVLPAVGLLITDYSSIAYDFALTGRPIAFLAPDLDDYATSHGLYEPYTRFSSGTEVRSWPELLELLARADSDTAVLDTLEEHSARLAAECHAFHDGRSTERVYSEILARLREPA